jgi:hypothetical protein
MSLRPDQDRRRTAALSIGLIGFARQEKFVTKLRQRDLYVKNLAVSLQVGLLRLNTFALAEVCYRTSAQLDSPYGV